MFPLVEEEIHFEIMYLAFEINWELYFRIQQQKFIFNNHCANGFNNASGLPFI